MTSDKVAFNESGRDARGPSKSGPAEIWDVSKVRMRRLFFTLCVSSSLLLGHFSSALNFSAIGPGPSLLSVAEARPLPQAVLTRGARPLPQAVLTRGARPLPQAVLTRGAPQQPARKINSEALKKYVGRYELEAGIIPISTLDVTLENNELWVKPSVVKKRRLVHQSKTVFVDEIAGTPLTFNKDDGGKPNTIVSLTFQYEGASYTAPKVTLPPPSLKGNTTFRLKGYPDAGIVALAGSFNNWSQSEFIFGKEGDEWVCRIDLEPGKHAYKFIVDGNWLLDPANPNTEDDDYGVKNSFIVVVKNSDLQARPELR